MDALPFSGRLGVESIRVRYVQTYQQLAYFICPKFMMPVWGRLLLNTDDFVIYGAPGGMFWPYSMHKFLVLGFISLLIPHRHWQLRGTPKVMVL